MLDPLELISYFKKKKINFFSGVPDSVLKNFTNFLDNLKNTEHYVCVNEGSAVGLAIGYYLRKKKNWFSLSSKFWVRKCNKSTCLNCR